MAISILFLSSVYHSLLVTDQRFIGSPDSVRLVFLSRTGSTHWRSLSPTLSSNYLACWSTELGQWGWSHATLAPSSNIPSQQARSHRSLEDSWGVLIVQIYVSYLLVMLLLVVLRGIISQVLVSWVPFHDELFVIDLVDHVKVILLHRS